MPPDEVAKWLIGLVATNSLAIIGLGFTVTRWFARLELKVDLMWRRYTNETEDERRLLSGIHK